MADYQSALIQSLRGASPAFGTSNPGVTLLPNPVVPTMPALNFRRGAGLPGGNLNVVPPAPPPAPYVPPPAPAQPPAPPAGGVAPPPDFTPPFVPVVPIGPIEPEVPDYNDDLWGPDPVPVPDYTDDLYGPDPVEPPAGSPAESEPAQTFPVPDQPELEFVDLDPLVPEGPVPDDFGPPYVPEPIPAPDDFGPPFIPESVPVPTPEPELPVLFEPPSYVPPPEPQVPQEPDIADLDPFIPELADPIPVAPIPVPEPEPEPPLIDEMPAPELILAPELAPVSFEPLDIVIEPPASEPVSLPDEFVDVLEPEVPIEDLGIVIEPPAGPPVSLPDEFVNQLQPDDQLTDQELLEMLLFEDISRELLTGPAETPVLPFPEFDEER